jgi:D-amino peptidase
MKKALMFKRCSIGFFLATFFVPAAAAAQGTMDYAHKTIPFEEGFRVYLIPDMEGMGSSVHVREIIAGTEGEQYRDRTGPDYWAHYRGLLTREANAVIEGARAGGAASFVVNEGHGGNRFANILPWELDQQAILIRGYPKPLVMSTAIDSTFGTIMFSGAHANAGSRGVMSHNYAFARFTVNGHVLNEVGINALIAGEMGISVSLVSGDDVLIAETEEILGNGFIGVVVKVAVGPNAAITYSPERVRQMLREAAEEAVTREMAGDFEPFVLDRPYNVEFTLRPTYPEAVVAGVDTITAYDLEKTGARSYRFVTLEARQIGYLLDSIEGIVLP